MRFEVDVHPVELDITCDGVRGLPSGFKIEGVFALLTDAKTGRVSGLTARNPSMDHSAPLPKAKPGEVVILPHHFTFGIRAPGYRPTTIRANGKPARGRANLVRGVTVKIHPGSYPVPRLRAVGGSEIRPASFHRTAVYLLDPGREYELLSPHLRTFLVRFHVPDTFDEMGVFLFGAEDGLVIRTGGDADNDRVLPLPPRTTIKIESEGPARGAMLSAVVGEDRFRFSASTTAIVLPQRKPVTFTLEHPRLIPTSDSVDRVVRGPVEELRFNLEYGPSVVFLVPTDAGSGRFFLYEPDSYADPLFEGPFSVSSEKSSSAAGTKRRRVTGPYFAAPGRYDVWIVPQKRAPTLVRNVMLDNNEVDLGDIGLKKGTIVIIELQALEPPGQLRSLEKPGYIRAGERTVGTIGGQEKKRLVVFQGCRPGPHEWMSNETRLRIDVPDAEYHMVSR
ncbi:MAG: hypothetical protein AAF488_16010 [Planctomycetota bacterium]